MMSRQEKFGMREKQAMESRFSFSRGILIAVLAIIVVVVAVGLGVFFYVDHNSAVKAAADKEAADQATEISQVQKSFVDQNGSTAKVLQSATQTKVYIVAWQDDKNQYISALLGGVWIKLYGQPLVAATPTPTPTPTP